MKKSIYFLMMFAGLAFTSCEPLDDIHEEIDAEIDAAPIVGETSFTLTEDDYKDEEAGLGLNFANFNSVDDAKTLIPELLDLKYPVWGSGSLATVTFDVYASLPKEDSLVVYEVTTEDYDSYPETERFNNFDDMDQIYTFLNDKYPNIEDGTLVALTYKYYDGQASNPTNGFLYEDGEWIFAEGFTEEEYSEMGESFDNFPTEDIAAAKIPIFLKEKYKYQDVKAGEIVPVTYRLYTDDIWDIDGDGNTDENTTNNYIMYFIYDGSEWVEYTNIETHTLQFGHDGDVWVPDNTIRYTLTDEDYTLIGDALIEKYPGPADNAAFFQSFERRSGDAEYWSDEMLLEAINILLDERHPSAEEGQKYVVLLTAYAGGYSTEEWAVIKKDGVWVLQE